MKNRKNPGKRIIMTGILLAMVVHCLGCGPFGEVAIVEDTEMTEDNLIVVGVSQLGSESVWRSANTVSIQKELSEENGYFLIFNNARQKQDNQIKALRGFISQRVDYIVFSPVEETGYGTVLKEAKDAGIPVILMDRAVCLDDILLATSRVGSDFLSEGNEAAKWLEEELIKQKRQNEQIDIVILKGTEGSSAQIGRSEGFAMIARKHENWNIIEEEYADFTSKKGEEVMAKFLRRHDKIDVVVSQNDDMTFGALEAIKADGRSVGVGGDIMMISFDAVSESLQLVKDGVINVEIECNPNQGKYISEVIQRLEQGEKVQKKYSVEEQVFTIDNVTQQLIDQRSY